MRSRINRFLANLFVYPNKLLNELGIVTPWLMKRKDCYKYWEKKAEKDIMNMPEEYLKKDLRPITYVGKKLRRYVRKGKLIEIGCNVGTNIHVLKKLGFDVDGLEISKNAVRKLRKHYKSLKNSKIYTGRAEKLLPKMKDNSYDIVFSMAVLMHIHPTSKEVFKEMVRISKKYIYTVESEEVPPNSTRLFGRNYKRVFEGLGCKQVFSKKVKLTEKEKKYMNEIEGLNIRLFKKV